MLEYIRQQCREIRDDDALRFYGGALAFVNVLTAYYWLTAQPVASILSPQSIAICWPMWPSCAIARIIPEPALVSIFIGLLMSSLVTVGLFCDRDRVSAAYLFLLVTTFVKIAILFQDYRLALNQHYVALTVTLPFLFLPQKRDVIRWLIVMIYFWAGSLKLNNDWLSGQALYGRKPLGVPGSMIPLACYTVVVLELVGSWFLVLRRRSMVIGALCAFIIFHVTSFAIVGYFYPLLMFCVLALVPLVLAIPGARTENGRLAWIVLPQGWALGAIVLFSLAQLVPRAIAGDEALTGEGRLVALNMFDAPITCRAEITLKREAGTFERLAARPPFLQPRIGCDPIVYWGMARTYCSRSEVVKGGADISLLLESRRVSAGRMATIISVDRFCAKAPSYSIWRHNDWIERN